MVTTLDRCKYCNAEASSVKIPGLFPNDDYWCVACSKCSVKAYAKTLEEVTTIWNNKPSLLIPMSQSPESETLAVSWIDGGPIFIFWNGTEWLHRFTIPGGSKIYDRFWGAYQMTENLKYYIPIPFGSQLPD